MISFVESYSTLSEALASQARHQPDTPAFLWLDEQDNEVHVSFREFEQASRRAANSLGRNSNPDDVVGVIGVVDTIVHQTVVMGLVAGQIVPFPMSPRLPPVAVVHLMRSTNCHRLVISRAYLPDLAAGIEEELRAHHPEYELIFEDFPALETLYPTLEQDGSTRAAEPFERVAPAAGSYRGGVYLHSSGSTGLPKPIRLDNRVLTSFAQFPIQREMMKGAEGVPRLGAMSPPPHHMLGFMVQCVWNVWDGHTVVLYRPTGGVPVAPTANNILDLTLKTKCHSLVVVPSFLKIWLSQPENVEKLAQIPSICFGGGPLTPAVGDALVKAGVTIRSMYGATEFGPCVYFSPSIATKEEWQWLQFCDRTDVRWEDQGDGTYEAIVMACPTHVLAVENLKGAHGYATNDLFEKHPTKEGLWRIVGRKDDVLIHSTGEKTVPGPMQEVIAHSPLVRGALMFGRDKDRPGVLIDPSPDVVINVADEKQVAEFRNRIWPTIIEANAIAPAYSKIYKEMIMIITPDKPLDYNSKGTIVRKTALQKYTEEIDAMYNTIEAESSNSSVAPPAEWSTGSTREWLLRQVQDILDGPAVKADVDLFEQGLDSLSSTFLRLRLSGALKRTSHSAAGKINEATVYSHPTIDSLAALISGGDESIVTIEDLIRKYSHGLDESIPSSPLPNELVVLLTGSTGNLGAELLLRLLQDPRVKTVYAVNRHSDEAGPQQRHEERFADRGFDTTLLFSDKLVYLESNLSQERLGLSNSNYDLLKSTVTTVIHNAWRLDFNLSLSSFEPHVRGTRNLIDLARFGKYGANTKFIFTSSIASAQSWDESLGKYPEEHVEDARYARGAGYGESKYVSERILKHSGLNATSIRIGQVAGGTPNGAWATTDWVAIIVKSGITLGKLPDRFGDVTWMPMDGVANATMDFARIKERCFAVNVVNPKPVAWTTVFTYIRDALVEQGKPKLQLIPFEEWINEVTARPNSEAADIPAWKILDFLRTVARGRGECELATKVSEQLSDAMSSQGCLRPADAERWVRYWLQKGL